MRDNHIKHKTITAQSDGSKQQTVWGMWFQSSFYCHAKLIRNVVITINNLRYFRGPSVYFTAKNYVLTLLLLQSTINEFQRCDPFFHSASSVFNSQGLKLHVKGALWLRKCRRQNGLQNLIAFRTIYYLINAR